MNRKCLASWPIIMDEFGTSKIFRVSQAGGRTRMMMKDERQMGLNDVLKLLRVSDISSPTARSSIVFGSLK